MSSVHYATSERNWSGWWHKVPIIILTGLAGEEEVVQGLDFGANDYITQPFRFNELAARLRAQLHSFDESKNAVVSLGPFYFYPSKKLLQDPTKKGVIRLTDKESMVLKYLVRAGSHRLRQKIEADPAHPRLVVKNNGRYFSGRIVLKIADRKGPNRRYARTLGDRLRRGLSPP
jgi:hypothetical protein